MSNRAPTVGRDQGRDPADDLVENELREESHDHPQSRVPTPFRWLLGWLLTALVAWLLLYRTERDLQVALTVLVSLAGTAAVWVGSRVGSMLTGPRMVRRLALTPRQSVYPAGGFDRVLVWIGMIALAYLTMVNVRSSGGGSLDLGQALTNPSHAYIERQRSIALARGTGGPSLLIHLATVFLYVLPAVLVLRWRRLGALTRWLGLSVVVGYGGSWLVVGTLKGFIETAILLSVCLAVARSRRVREAKRRVQPAALLTLVIVGAGVVALAAHTLGARLMDAPNHRIPPSILESALGEQGAVGLAGFIGYFAQGHSGLGASLSEPFVWTEGSGSSEGFQSLVPWLANAREHLQAYPYRAEMSTGWPAKDKWQTVYPWLASDLTFAGAVGFVGFIAFLAATAWVIASGRGGVLATAIFAQLYLTLVYIPLNNGPINSTSNLVAAVLLWVCAVAYRLDLGRRRAASVLTTREPVVVRSRKEGLTKR